MMKENKKVFSEPNLVVVKFTAQDIIATSGGYENSSNPVTDKFPVFNK